MSSEAHRTKVKSSNKSSDRSAGSSLWTSRRLDDFFVNGLIRSLFPRSSIIEKVAVTSAPERGDPAATPESIPSPSCPSRFVDAGSTVTTMSGKCPAEFMPSNVSDVVHDPADPPAMSSMPCPHHKGRTST